MKHKTIMNDITERLKDKHVHKWELYTAGITGRRVIARCSIEGCGKLVRKGEIEDRLNETDLLEACEWAIHQMNQSGGIVTSDCRIDMEDAVREEKASR